VAENIKGDRAKVLRTAYEEVEGDEDEHLYHSMGWGASCGSSRWA